MFTEDEVNECINHLLVNGPRLVPVTSIEAMRSCLLDFAEGDFAEGDFDE